MAESVTEQFKRELYAKYEKNNKTPIKPKEKYAEILEELKSAYETTGAKSNRQYYLMGKYEIIQWGSKHYLMKMRDSPDDTKYKYFVSIEEAYDVIRRAHEATGHGGRVKMLHELNRKYANATAEAVELFKSYCIICQKQCKRTDNRREPANGQPGDNVAVVVPRAYRGPLGPRNVLGIILERDENNMYTICVKSGILKPKYARHRFIICPKRLLKESDVDHRKKVTLRQAVINESMCEAWAHIKCNCLGSGSCESNRCSCFKNKVKCSSRCHGCQSCKNYNWDLE